MKNLCYLLLTKQEMAFRGVLPANTQVGQFQNSQDYQYNTVQKLGYPLPPGASADYGIMSQTNAAVNTADPYLGEMNMNRTQSEFQNLFYSTKFSDDLETAFKNCQKTGIDNLIINQDNSRVVRCGWLYKPPINNNIPVPQFSQGALGITSGPFPYSAAYKTTTDQEASKGSEWFWSLEKAKKRILTDRCQALQHCEDVGSQNFQSCGYCTGIGQGVPVNKYGVPLYPADNRLACSNGYIISDAGSCPKPPAPQPVGPDGRMANGQLPDVCTPVDGKLSRECVLGLITRNGCQAAGSLYQAVQNSTNPNDYIDTLRGSVAFQTYNTKSAKQGTKQLSINLGTASLADLNGQFQQLSIQANNTSIPKNSGMSASSRDMCLKQGSIGDYDPCMEIPDSATPPYDLACLQRNFERVGGQPAGRKYPSIANKFTLYDNMSNYGKVREYWNKILANTKSNDYSVQKGAMLDMYGINTSP